MKSVTYTKFCLAVLAWTAVLMGLIVPSVAHAQATVPVETDVLQVLITVALGFASLVGMSQLVAVIVNLLKVFGLVKDGTASQWAAGINLAGFVVLVVFGVFRPDLALDVLDGIAGQVAMVLLFVLGFITQIIGSKVTHVGLSKASVPLIGKSYSA